ncbi:MAG TPA: peptidylprolyl isomerase [Candidatus Bathyarchaeia archaeon]|nr:peptidylprolyl isomerase [Candidatus Bathyarchaeia archaeon]
MSVKRGDFIKLSYTGRLDDGDVFDTTDEGIAKENGLFAEGVSYAPITIVVGENMVVKGLDADFIGKKAGFKGKVTLTPQDAFGQRIPELIEVVPTRRFEKRPVPGMRVSLDNRTGTVESVIGGRVRVDFNSPYAGKTINYEYKIEAIITDTVEKVRGLFKYYLNKDFNVSTANGKVTVEMPYELGFNQQVQYYKKLLAEKIIEFAGAEEVDYVEIHKRPEPVSEEAAAAKAAPEAAEPTKRTRRTKTREGVQ